MILPRRLNMPVLLGLLTTVSLATNACQPEGGFPKQEPVDLVSGPGPAASDFSTEADLETRYGAEILPWYLAHAQEGSFSGVSGVPIHYAVFETSGEKGAIVFLPGRTEPVLKHAENIQDLVKQGYSVYAMDHRGQGASGRMTDDPEMGYVEYFKDYVDDVDTFVRRIVQPARHRNLFLLAHSMGGGISAQYLYENPGIFKAVALSSPMLDINTSPFPKSVAMEISGTVCAAGDGKSFAIGQADFDSGTLFTDTQKNDVTRSLPRFNVKMRMFADNPSLRLGGVSYRWLCESLGQTMHLPKLGYYSRIPTLLFQAGQDDIVTLPAEDRYCDDAAACQKVVYPDAYHEILSERDAIRNDALAKTVRFFNHFASE